MQTKANQVAALLRGKTVFYVNIETPNGHNSTDETTLEKDEGISHRIEGNRIIFTAEKTTAAFEVLETVEILTNRTEDTEIIVTLTVNGGLQVKSHL
jgi:hypothetical protein